VLHGVKSTLHGVEQVALHPLQALSMARHHHHHSSTKESSNTTVTGSPKSGEAKAFSRRATDNLRTSVAVGAKFSSAAKNDNSVEPLSMDNNDDDDNYKGGNRGDVGLNRGSMKQSREAFVTPSARSTPVSPIPKRDAE